jgi:DNA-binding NarL/FixJ family response regulator
MGLRPKMNRDGMVGLNRAASPFSQPHKANLCKDSNWPSAPARILVVEDSLLMRQALNWLINDQPEFSFCPCDMDTAQDLISAVEIHRPDVLILDLWFQDASTLPCIQPLKVRFPALKILVFTDCEERFYAELAINAGASGYVLKSERPEEVLFAIRAVLNHEVYLSHKIASERFRQIVGSGNTTSPVKIDHLTMPELEVFLLLSAGRSPSEMAQELAIPVELVESHCKQLRVKLKPANPEDLTSDGVRGGLNLQDDYDDYAEAMMDCAMQWKPLGQSKSPLVFPARNRSNF